MASRNARAVYDELRRLGWSDVASRALVGGFIQESGSELNTEAIHDQGTGIGIAGFRNERKQGLLDFANRNQGMWNDPVVQAQYVDHELRNGEARAGRVLRNAATVEDAALGAMMYERPQGFSWDNPRAGHGWNNRLSNAQGLSLASTPGSPLAGRTRFRGAMSDGGESIQAVAAATLQDPSSSTQQRQAAASILTYANQGATRNRPVTDSLSARLQDSVAAVYGPGYTVQVYSGGQPGEGEEGGRVGTFRHDHGKAADARVYDPQGKQVTGDRLAPLGQYWLANKYGGVGMEMKGGGIHLDEHVNPKRGGMFWNYGNQGGTYTDVMAAAMGAGSRGEMPTLAGQAGQYLNAAVASAAPNVAPTAEKPTIRNFMGQEVDKVYEPTKEGFKAALKEGALDTSVEGLAGIFGGDEQQQGQGNQFELQPSGALTADVQADASRMQTSTNMFSSLLNSRRKRALI